MTKLKFETRACPVHVKNITRWEHNPHPGSEGFTDRQVVVQILNECVRPCTEMVAA